MTEATPYTLRITIKSQYRIGVGVKVLEVLKYPKRIRLLMHPEKLQVIVQPCDVDEPCSFKVSYKRVFERRHGPEISSAKLMHVLMDRLSFKRNSSYRIYGHYVPENKNVLFDLNNYCVIDEAEPEETE